MMKSYPSSFIYINLVLLSLLMIMSSENWFFTWMAFEMSLFGFIPLLSMNSLSSEGIMKYFMVQAAGSSLYFMSVLLSVKSKEALMLMGLVMKLGIFPFFQWMPSVMMSLNWMNSLILITLQKLGPLMVLMMLSYKNHMLMLASMSILISGIWGFNQLMMRSLMAYSSIAHTSWIIMTISMSTTIFMMYILFYFITSAVLFTSFKNSKMEKVMESKTKNLETSTQIFSFIILLGLPPFSIFFMKLNIIIFFSNFIVLLMMMILGTFMSTYYYLSFLIPSMMTTANNNNMMMKNMFMLLFNMLPLVLLI